MTPEQLTRAASQLEAALFRLDIQPGHSTEAELAQDDAKILPSLVNGQAPGIADLKTCMDEETLK